jgi:Tat protein translocase TatB subunit
MNIFSNIGVTELVLILLLALLVVGPERLPELGRKLGKTLRDVRKAYENLTKDLGPELRSIQQTTQELRDSVEAVRSIPQDMVQTIVKAADLDSTMADLKGVTGSLDEVGRTLSDVGKTATAPIVAAVATTPSIVPPSSATPAGMKEQAGPPLVAEKAEVTQEPVAADSGSEDQAISVEAAEEATEAEEAEVVDSGAEEQAGE